MKEDTIAAIATPNGRGGIGVIRVSGPETPAIVSQLLQKQLKPRYASYARFLAHDKNIIDEGLALFFPKPNSFTGEDVLELQGHGGPVVLDQLLQRVLQLGARLAEPGEFSQRAFLNDKIDLAQAEAIADLIDASSAQAARSAVRSLQGEFSTKIQSLLNQLIELRKLVEASIDFPEEEIDFLQEHQVVKQLQSLIAAVEAVLQSAQKGVLLRDGITVVIAGKPNAGKSSLLNCLAKRDRAIVTDIPGTTRDVLREYIQLNGMPLHIIDTAGLREAGDAVEQEGIRRTWQEVENADLVLLVIDANESDLNSVANTQFDKPTILIKNKIDLTEDEPGVFENSGQTTIAISAKTQQGITELEQFLQNHMGYHSESEGEFSARQRHVNAIQQTAQHLQTGLQQLKQHNAGELLAEDLRQAQYALAEITGEFSADDLLGEIFSSFCIGK